MPPRLFHHLRPIRKLHQRVLLAGYGGPIQQQPLRALAIVFFQNVHGDAKLEPTGASKCEKTFDLTIVFRFKIYSDKKAQSHDCC